MEQLKNRFIKVKYGSKLADAVIEKLEELGVTLDSGVVLTVEDIKKLSK